MNKEKQITKDLSIDKRISKAERKIKGFFKNLGEDKFHFVSPAIHQLAVIQITLERLSDEINNSDILENFEQGSQKFRRENPALKSYNSTIKSYALLYKQLIDLLPAQDAARAGQALMNFVARPQVVKK